MKGQEEYEELMELRADIEAWIDRQIVNGDPIRERCAMEVRALVHPDKAIDVVGEESIA